MKKMKSSKIPKTSKRPKVFFSFFETKKERYTYHLSVAKQLKQSHYKLTNMELTSLKDINKDNVKFEGPFTYHNGRSRINIKVNGRFSTQLVIATPFQEACLGLQKTYNKKGEHVGYHFLFPLHDMTRKEVDFLSALKELKSLCYKHIEEKFCTGMADTMKFPMSEDCFLLYPKLKYNKDTKEIQTPFYTKFDNHEKELEDPLFYLGKRCRVKMAIVIDCILVDEVASVQLKVNDVYVEPLLDDWVDRLTYLSDDEEEYGVEATESYWQTSTEYRS
ncbi:hypothetical protein AWC38_SpisGene24176 [Stylophora pistillata]|uniref:Uncharacterized protein n=1 Tax=Stylophora pistillata TaxID=50429 RepID=A0A2B4R547_STYPI|nr:hypothetical protein AWC38_SpisGene24176 [Stylophora pistillata]